MQSQCFTQRSGAAPQQRRISRAARLQCTAVAEPNKVVVKARTLLQSCGLSLAAAAVLAATALAPMTPPAHALLTSSDPIKNAQALLRYALPIDNKPMRSVQKELEDISAALRIPGNKSLGPVARAVRDAQYTLKEKRNDIVKDFAPAKKAEGLAALDALDASLIKFQAIVEAKDKQEVPIAQRDALAFVGQAEEAMVKGFPFAVPAEYDAFPQLLGRAKLEMLVHIEETPQGPIDAKLDIVLDGYNAPVSAGNFYDLVQRKFYDGMDIQRSDGFVVQTGDPAGPDEGFKEPGSNEIRRIPLEIRVVGEKVPIYDFTLEDLGRYNEQPVLPFNAFGTMAIARNEFENNSGSSQIFFLLRESELTPSGANLLDGRYAVFGYVVEGQDALGNMKVGDKIRYIKIVGGEENFKAGKGAVLATPAAEVAEAAAMADASAVVAAAL